MQFFSESFLDEISSLALTIAYAVRKENRLQPLDVIRSKFQTEEEELKAADEPWDELPDVTYYTACAYVQGDSSLLAKLDEIAATYNVTLDQLEAGTLAKYRLRAVQPKNIAAERTAILAAISPQTETVASRPKTKCSVCGECTAHINNCCLEWELRTGELVELVVVDDSL